MHDALALVLALLVCYLPGLALMAALGARRPVLLVALAPAVSIAVAGVTAVVAALLGLPFNALALGLVTVVLGVVGVVRVLFGGAPLHDRLRWRRPRLSSVLGVLMVVVGVGYGVLTWLGGLDGLSTVPQEHDMVIHAMQVAYITRTGNGAPWELVPADVLTGTPVSFYPSGLHLLAGATANITGNIVQAINAVTVVILAITLSLSVAALAYVAARQLRLARPAPLLAAGVASLVAAGMFRPAFSLMHDGGVLSNAATLALMPGVVAGLLLLPRAPRGVAVSVGAACAGVVLAHPSAVASIGVTIVAWWVGMALTRQGREQLRGLASRLAVTAVSAGVLLVPMAVVAYPSLTTTSGFGADLPPASVIDALASTFGLAYGGHLDPARQLYQLVAALAAGVGVLCLIVLRRNFGLVAAWAVWTVITIAAFLTPGTGPVAIITGFFYNAQLRVWSHVSLLVPVLAGLGAVIIASSVAVWVRRHSPVPAVGLATALVLVVFVGYAVGPGLGYARTNEYAVATRYSTPDFLRVDADDRQAIAWLAEHIQPGQRVFNSPNDGSTYLYVDRGIPVVNVYTLGLPGVPYSYRLLQRFASYPTDPEVRAQLVSLNVAWVYVDAEAPGIGTSGSPEGWAGDDGFGVAPSLQHLDGLPGMTRAFMSGSVTVYALDLNVLRTLKVSQG